MDLTLVYFVFLLFARDVLASQLAGSWQTMFLWNARRIESIANDGVTTIAPGCGKDCDFDKFLEEIKGPGSTWKGGSGVASTDLDPDVEKTVKALKEKGYDADHAYWKVLPGKFTYDPANRPAVDKTYGEASNIIQKAREKVGDDKIKDQLSNVRSCASKIHAMRLVQEEGAMVRDLNDQIRNKLKTAGKSDAEVWKVETRPETAPDGTTYEKFNSRETLRAHPGESKALLKYVEDFASFYRDPKNKKKFGKGKNPAGHYNGMKFFEKMANVLKGPSCGKFSV